MEEGLDFDSILQYLIEDDPIPDVENYHESSDEDNDDVIEMDVDQDGEINEENLNSLQNRFQAVVSTFPRPPSNQKDEYRFDFHLFNYLKLKLYYLVFGKPNPPRPDFTDEQVEHSAAALYMHMYYREFIENLKQIQTDVLNRVIRDILLRTGNDPEHPLTQIMWHIAHNKELHSRRIKASPSKQRNKLSVGERPDNVYNVVTLEECYFGDRPSSLKWMIFVPLPSDYDENAVDPEEGGYEHKVAIFADQLQDCADPTYDVADPFGFVVTPEWETLLSFIHNISFFDEYIDVLLYRKLHQCQDLYDQKTVSQWNLLWEALVTPEYSQKSIKQFSSNNSKPVMVSTLCKVRDLFRAILVFHKQLQPLE